MSLSVQGSDLIFKHGFENTRLVSGQVSGLVASGLELQLTTDNENVIQINENSVFTFELKVAIGQFWQVNAVKLPDDPHQQNCRLSNNTGVMDNNGVDDVLVVCNDKAWNWNEMNWEEGSWN